MYHEICVFDGQEPKHYYLPANQYTAAEALETIKELYPTCIVSYERSVLT